MGSSVYLWREGTVNHKQAQAPLATGSLSITDTAQDPATTPMSLLSSQTHYGTLTGGCTYDSSLDHNHTQIFACIQVLNLGPQTTQILSLNKVAETPPWRPQAGLLQGPDTGLACLLVIPPPSPPGAHLSLSVSMGTLFFSQVIRGLGSPWIWHWKRATPPSSPTVA